MYRIGILHQIHDETKLEVVLHRDLDHAHLAAEVKLKNIIRYNNPSDIDIVKKQHLSVIHKSFQFLQTTRERGENAHEHCTEQRRQAVWQQMKCSLGLVVYV